MKRQRDSRGLLVEVWPMNNWDQGHHLGAWEKQNLELHARRRESECAF